MEPNEILIHSVHEFDHQYLLDYYYTTEWEEKNDLIYNSGAYQLGCKYAEDTFDQLIAIRENRSRFVNL